MSIKELLLEEVSQHTSVLVKGASGTTASLGSLYLSLLPQLETALRITSLLVGIAVGIITFISIYRNMRKKG